MSRFYTPIDLAVDQSLQLPDTVFHHWVRVLRAQVGDQATLFNGQGGEYLASLNHIDKKSAQVKILSFEPFDRAPNIKVTLGQVMSKGDRMDYAIQKATELGVHAIQLLVSERCEMRLKYDRDQKKIEHWQQVAVAACEQCGLNRIPTLLPPLPLSDWLAQVTTSRRYVLALSAEQQPTGLADMTDVSLLIGPEGGLSEAEILLSEQHGFTRWQMGARVMRTETAPIVALALLGTAD
jgi:16S rRNA (uracil1498-N3)-methyltransferase